MNMPIQAVSGTTSLRWNILSSILRQLQLAWHLTQPVNAARELRWNILQAIIHELALYWRGDGQFPDTPARRTLTIEPELREIEIYEDRTFYFAEESRVLFVRPENRALPVNPENRTVSASTSTIH